MTDCYVPVVSNDVWSSGDLPGDKPLSDDELETLIDVEYLKFASGKTVALRKRAWLRMNNLLKRRSAMKIRLMEEQQGLLD